MVVCRSICKMVWIFSSLDQTRSALLILNAVLSHIINVDVALKDEETFVIFLFPLHPQSATVGCRGYGPTLCLFGPDIPKMVNNHHGRTVNLFKNVKYFMRITERFAFQPIELTDSEKPKSFCMTLKFSVHEPLCKLNKIPLSSR